MKFQVKCDHIRVIIHFFSTFLLFFSDSPDNLFQGRISVKTEHESGKLRILDELQESKVSF